MLNQFWRLSKVEAMTYYRQDGKPTRHTVTKPNAILSWDLRNPSATPEQRAKAMAEIEKRFARREK